MLTELAAEKKGTSIVSNTPGFRESHWELIITEPGLFIANSNNSKNIKRTEK